MKRIISALLGICLASFSTFAFPYYQMNPVQIRYIEEQKVPDFYGITFHKPNYLLPYYYTVSPYNSIYRPFTPSNQSIRNAEIKYQFSFKIPLWKNIFDSNISFFVAYTQMAYWQAYAPRIFFREYDHLPEVYFSSEMNRCLVGNWMLNFLNVGFVHQSNGWGNDLERSWERIYLEGITSIDNWMIDIKPWIIVSKNKRNTDIGRFLGYLDVVAAYKWNNGHVLSLEGYNFVESGFKRPSAQLTWSFPLTHNIKGFFQVFSGYGQSIIEYNHRTNAAGVGLSVNDWI